MSKVIIGSDLISQNLRFHVNKSWKVSTVFNTKQPDVQKIVFDMKTPRTILNTDISDEHFETLSSLLEPGDVILDYSRDYFEKNIEKASLFQTKSIGYLGCSMMAGNKYGPQGPTMLVSGDARYFYEQERFLREFCGHVFYIDENPETSQFVQMIHDSMRDAITHGFHDIFTYTGQDCKKMEEIKELCRTSDINGHLLSAYSMYMNFETDHRYKRYIFENNLPSAVIHNCIESKQERYFPTNDIFSATIAMNTLRFLYASVFLEGISLLCSRRIHIMNAMTALNTGSVLTCPMMSYRFQSLYDVLDETEMDVRLCIGQSPGCPAIQSALDNYDNLKYLDINEV